MAGELRQDGLAVLSNTRTMNQLVIKLIDACNDDLETVLKSYGKKIVISAQSYLTKRNRLATKRLINSIKVLEIIKQEKKEGRKVKSMEITIAANATTKGFYYGNTIQHGLINNVAVDDENIALWIKKKPGVVQKRGLPGSGDWKTKSKDGKVRSADRKLTPNAFAKFIAFKIAERGHFKTLPINGDQFLQFALDDHIPGLNQRLVKEAEKTAKGFLLKYNYGA